MIALSTVVCQSSGGCHLFTVYIGKVLSFLVEKILHIFFKKSVFMAAYGAGIRQIISEKDQGSPK